MEKVLWDPIRAKETGHKKRMLHYLYEGIKREINLDIYYEPPKETKSDEVFAIFHPGLNVKLSDVLEGTGGVDSKGFMNYLKANYDPKEIARKKLELDSEYIRDMQEFGKSSTKGSGDYMSEGYLQSGSKDSWQYVFCM